MWWNIIVKIFDFVKLIEKKQVLKIFRSENDSANLYLISVNLIWTNEDVQICLIKSDVL
jgi:hypothetical protein